jgi:hypothetical protein
MTVFQMKLYGTVCNDHHCDPEIKVWLHKDSAIDYAKSFMALYEDVEEIQSQEWLYYAKSLEDFAYVLEVDVINE